MKTDAEYQALEQKLAEVEKERNILHTVVDVWKGKSERLTAERDALAADCKRKGEALRGIVEFCDDPHGSNSVESLALGLSRLLPAARAALSAPDANKEKKS